MANQESIVFKVGDVVSLKVQPEFRGVIEIFFQKNNNSFTGIIEGPVDAQQNSNVWARISFLDVKYNTRDIVVPMLHLKFPE